MAQLFIPCDEDFYLVKMEPRSTSLFIEKTNITTKRQLDNITARAFAVKERIPNTCRYTWFIYKLDKDISSWELIEVIHEMPDFTLII